MANEVLRIEKKINASPERLFRAWLTPEDFSRWFLAGETTIGEVVLDPRPGGKFRIDMHMGGKVLPHEGEYRTIEEPNKLVFTWKSHATGGFDTLVTVTFTALGSATMVTLVHELLANEKSVAGHSYGWTNILMGLEKWMNEGQF